MFALSIAQLTAKRRWLGHIKGYSLVLVGLAALCTATLVPRARAEQTGSLVPFSRKARVLLSVVPTSTPWTWSIRLENQDEAPVRIIADIRSLRLLVRSHGDSTYHVCALPSRMKPDRVHRWLQLDPGQAWQETFDPRLFCWGTKASQRLAPGASITAFYGYHRSPRRHRWRRPHVRALPSILLPVFDPAPFGPSSELVSLTTWLRKTSPSPLDVSSAIASAKKKKRPYRETKLALDAPRWSDAPTPRNTWLSVRLRNVGNHPAVVHLRPDNLVVNVTGPDGGTGQCGPGPKARALVRDFFRTIGPGQSARIRMRLYEYCGPDMFQQPGLYKLVASVVLRETGASYGLQAFTGDVTARHETLLRVQTGRLPWYSDPPKVASRP